MPNEKYGTELHFVLSQMKGLADLGTALTKAKDKGLVSLTNADKITAEIKDLFTDDKFSSYFTSEVNLNEKNNN